MTRSFEVQTRREGTISVVSVRGDVDMDSSPRLRDELQRALRDAEEVAVRLDEVNYLDSSGIAILIQGLKWAQKAGVGYVLRDPSPQVRQVIELAQLHQLFTIESSGGS